MKGPQKSPVYFEPKKKGGERKKIFVACKTAYEDTVIRKKERDEMRCIPDASHGYSSCSEDWPNRHYGISPFSAVRRDAHSVLDDVASDSSYRFILPALPLSGLDACCTD